MDEKLKAEVEEILKDVQKDLDEGVFDNAECKYPNFLQRFLEFSRKGDSYETSN